MKQPSAPAGRRSWGLVVLLAAPWLVGMGYAPDPSMVPRLFSWTVLVLLWVGRTGLTLNHLYWGLLWASGLNALIGLGQYLGYTSLLPSWVETAQVGEAYGQLRQRNQFATLMNLGLLAALCAELGPARSRAWTAGRLVLIALLVIANVASASRTGALECLLVLVFTGIVRGSVATIRLRLIVALVAFLVAEFLLPYLGGDGHAPNLLTRLEEVPDCGSRLVLWSNVLTLISQRPWLGWGWGELDYAHFMAQYEGTRFCELLDNAHNLPLQLGVELGLPLTMLLLFGGAWWIWHARPWRETALPRQMAWVMLGLIGVHSLLEYPLWFGPFQFTVLVLLGLLASGGALQVGVATGIPVGGRARGLLMPGLALVTLLYVAWDYQRISQLYRPMSQRWPAYRVQTPDTMADSLLFRDAQRFAHYTLTPLTPGNAGQLYDQGVQLLHFSPEPRVVSKLIEAAYLLGRAKEAEVYEARFQAVYPQEHAHWRRSIKQPTSLEAPQGSRS